jgi:hypothetical protein
MSTVSANVEEWGATVAMPLDSGAVTDSVTLVAQAASGRIIEGIEPFMSGGVGFGGALRAMRESRGLGLQEIADSTRVRRPFAIGYVRAYAQVLGIDAEDAVAKFKECAPLQNEPLRAPIGVRRHRDPRLSFAAAAAGIVVTAVLVWNLAQHAVAGDGPASPLVPVSAAAPAAVRQGPVTLAAAQPAPAESDVPKPYITPGLAPASVATAPQTAQLADVASAIFAAKGAVYGAAADQSPVTLQARKPASIVVRGADGTVYFARQLAAGEAYRAPVTVKGLVVDVSEPAAFDIYLNGSAHGQLESSQTPVEKLTG